MTGVAHVIFHHLMLAALAHLTLSSVHIVTGTMFHLCYCRADENHERSY
jgi:hypothetical protein